MKHLKSLYFSKTEPKFKSEKTELITQEIHEHQMIQIISMINSAFSMCLFAASLFLCCIHLNAF